MGSTAMHFCLTKQVINKLKIFGCNEGINENTSKIYIGGTLPDFAEVHKKTKEQSHYLIEIEKNGVRNRIPDIDLFLKIHGKEILNNNYLLGELIHIVSDRIWYSEYITKYANNVSRDGERIFDFKQNKYVPFIQFKEKVYNDYATINQYILNKYNVNVEDILRYEKEQEIWDSILKNIKTNHCVNEFNFKKLNYIKEEDIKGWISDSENEIIEVIDKLRKMGNKGSDKKMKIIVGLGNIGKEYEKTRHNVGFIVVDKLAEKYGISSNKKMKKSTVLEGSINNKKVVIVKPTTFMNLSSAAIVEIKNWYKVENSDILVIYDDVDINFGDIRYREEGSAGTHNGMKDILATLKTNQLARVRVGIENRNGVPIPIIDYVLSSFTKDEMRMLETDIFTKIDEKVVEFLDK